MKVNHLNKLCAEFQFGMSLREPVRVYGSRGGSFLWKFETPKGPYIIKQLAPSLNIQDEKIVAKYELSETIADRFVQKGISAVPAFKTSDGKHLVIIDNIGYLVYPWIDSYTLDRHEVSEPHALKVAELQAKLHSIQLEMPEVGPPHFDISDNEKIQEAINKAISSSASFSNKLKDNQPLILSMNSLYHDAIPALKESAVITHGDLDQLNVLWDKSDQPILIDWESARRMNTTREIVRTSLRFSGIGTEHFSLSIYTRMMQTYVKSGDLFNQKHLSAALYSMVGSMVFWMLYNIEPACSSTSSEEKNTAIKEVNEVLMLFPRLDAFMPQLLNISIE